MSKLSPLELSLVVALGLGRAAAADETLLLRLPTEISTPRSLSLGGALVGLGGEASGFLLNPASLVAVPRSLDIVLSGGNHGGYGFGFAFHPYRKLAFGLLFPTSDRRLELVDTRPDGTVRLRPEDGRWLAFGIAWTPLDRRFSFGATGEVAHLRLLGGTGGKSERQHWVNASVGFFVQPDGLDGTRLGIAYRFGVDRTIDAAAGTFGEGEDAATYRVRRPDVLSVGASWRYAWLRNAQVTFTAQSDVVFYDKALDAADGNELDVRTGVEVAFPHGSCVSGCGGLWQVRLGLVSRAGVPTLAPGSAGGYDPGRRGASLVAGVSFADEKLFSGKLKFDVGYSRGCDSRAQRCNTFMGGVSFRFPSAFRGDLRQHRVRR